jgi:hypothetical protein
MFIWKLTHLKRANEINDILKILKLTIDIYKLLLSFKFISLT